MSVADKLLTVAENQKKVYDAGVFDAGYAKGFEEGYAEGIEQGQGAVSSPLIMDGRTSLRYFYQDLVDTYGWDFWKEYYNEETYEEGVLDLEVTPLEELPFPKGTKNITNFGGFASLWECVYGYMQDMGVPTKRFTGQLDVSGTNSLHSAFRDCKFLEDSGNIINSNNVTSFMYMYQGCSKLKTVRELDVSKASSLDAMFYQCEELENVNLVNIPALTSYSSTFYGCKKLKNFPVIDYSRATNLYMTFKGCSSMEVAPENMGLNSTTGGVSISGTFADCTSLKTIPSIKISASNVYDSAFNNCPALENLTIDGVLSKTNFNVSTSPLLTHDSLMSIINALQKKTSGTFKLQLGSANLAKLTDEEKLMITSKGWQVS